MWWYGFRLGAKFQGWWCEEKEEEDLDYNIFRRKKAGHFRSPGPAPERERDFEKR
jgi:hypothetical protein